MERFFLRKVFLFFFAYFNYLLILSYLYKIGVKSRIIDITMGTREKGITNTLQSVWSGICRIFLINGEEALRSYSL